MTDDEPPVKIEGKQSMSTALLNGYCSLLRVLHRNGVITAGDVAVDLGNTLDFRRQKGIETADQQEMLEMLYKAVLEIDSHETKMKELRDRRDAAPG